MPTRGYVKLEQDTVERMRRGGLLYKSADPSEEDRRRLEEALAMALLLAALVGASAARRWVTSKGAGFGQVPRNIEEALQKTRDDPLTSSVGIPAEVESRLASRDVVTQIVRRGERIRDGFSTSQRSQAMMLVTSGHRVTADPVVQDLMNRIRDHARIAELAAKQAAYIAFNDAIAVIASSPDGVARFPLWMIEETMDEVTRGNPGGRYPEPHRHWQFTGYVNTMAEIRRQQIVPPNGFNCRASMRHVSMTEATNLGLVTGGRIDPAKIRLRNGERQDLIDTGKYPDLGWIRVDAA